jgi:HEAT repeat protein
MNRKLQDRIEGLRQLRSANPSQDVVETLQKGLQDRANLIIAEAAKAVAALRLAVLIPDLLLAFDGLFNDPAKSDPKCWGKTAIAKTLVELDYDQSAPFLCGLRHIQMEPVWGGNEDSAAQLRGLCALALVQCTDLRRVEIMRYLVEAMIDSEDPVRAEAVRALAQLGGDDAALLLRLKARIGDRRPLVIGHVFDSLIGLEENVGVIFVAKHLESASAEIRDEAALSLGTSRRADAVEILITAWKGARSTEFRRILLRALSSSRNPAATDFLVDLVRTGNSSHFAEALEALELIEPSEEIRNRIEAAKNQR